MIPRYARIKRTRIKRSPKARAKASLLAIFLMVGTITNAQKSPQTGHSVLLTWTWTQIGDPATGFQIQSSTTSGGPYTAICGGSGQPACPAWTGGSCGSAGQPACPTYTDTSAQVVGGATLYYVVVVTGQGGMSLPSNQTIAQVPFLPPAAASGLQSQAH